MIVSPQHDFAAELRPGEYNVLSKRRVHRRFGFDLLVARSGSEEYRRYRRVLSTSALGTGAQKGDTKDMATISNEAQLQQAIEQIQVLCRAIESLRMDIFPKNPRNFAIMAEGPVDEIRKLQADIDAYLQHLEVHGNSSQQLKCIRSPPQILEINGSPCTGPISVKYRFGGPVKPPRGSLIR